MSERRQYASHEEDHDQRRQTAAAKSPAVIEHVLNCCKTQCDNPGKYDPVEYIVEITPKAEQQNKEAYSF